MIRKDDLYIIVNQQFRSHLMQPDTIPRNVTERINPVPGRAHILTGIRRSGKSTILRQLADRFGQVYYLSFEDLRLTGFESEDFEKLDNVFRENFGEQGVYLLDELQNVRDWERFIRQKLDEGCRMVITGSNAKLLSRELGTHLTGRHSDLEIFPFSYDEYLTFMKISDSDASFGDYFYQGGFPEFVRYQSNDYLQGLLTDILVRDIAVRHGVRNVKTLKEIAVYLLTNVSREFTYHSIRKIFQLGATSTVADYLAMFEECYLLFMVPRFDYSLKKQAWHPKKIYCVDNGLAIANSLSFSGDHGRMLENLVFNALRRYYREIYYYRNVHECDFLVREKGSVTEAFQVCYQLTSDNITRERDGLLAAMDEFGLNSGIILTMNESDVLKAGSKRIIIQPVKDWLISLSRAY